MKVSVLMIVIQHDLFEMAWRGAGTGGWTGLFFRFVSGFWAAEGAVDFSFANEA